MLKYWDSGYSTIHANDPNSILNEMYEKRRCSHQNRQYELSWRNNPIYRKKEASHHKDYNLRPEFIRIQQRLRYAIMRIIKTQTAEKAIVKGLVRIAMESVENLIVCPKNPNTNVEFGKPKHRVSMTFGRFVRRHLSRLWRYVPPGGDALRFEPTDKQIELGAIAYQTSPELPKLSIVSGQDAVNVYSTGTISSCMTGGNSEYVQHHFLANPDKIRLLIANNDMGRNVLRAKLLTNDDGTHYLDRIYWSYQDERLHSFQEQNLSLAIATELTKMGLNMVDYFKSTVTHQSGELMPYMDRIGQFDRLNSRQILLYEGGNYEAGDTCGEDPSCNSRRCRCGSCGDRIHEDDAHYENDTYYCESCFDSAFCSDDITGDTISNDDAIQLHDGQTTHRDNATQLDRAFYGRNQYAIDDDIVTDYDGRTILTDHASYLSDGEWYHDDDSSIVELHDGEHACEDDCVIIDDDEYDTTYALQTDCVSVVDNYGNQVWLLKSEVPQPAAITVDPAACGQYL